MEFSVEHIIVVILVLLIIYLINVNFCQKERLINPDDIIKVYGNTSPFNKEPIIQPDILSHKLESGDEKIEDIYPFIENILNKSNNNITRTDFNILTNIMQLLRIIEFNYHRKSEIFDDSLLKKIDNKLELIYNDNIENKPLQLILTDGELKTLKLYTEYISMGRCLKILEKYMDVNKTVFADMEKKYKELEKYNNKKYFVKMRGKTPVYQNIIITKPSIPNLNNENNLCKVKTEMEKIVNQLKINYNNIRNMYNGKSLLVGTNSKSKAPIYKFIDIPAI